MGATPSRSSYIPRLSPSNAEDEDEVLKADLYEDFDRWRTKLERFCYGDPDAPRRRTSARMHKKCLYRLEKALNRAPGAELVGLEALSKASAGDPRVNWIAENISILPPVSDYGGKSESPHLPVQIRCQPCAKYRSSAYSTEEGIVLCENNLKWERDFGEKLAHQLMHEYDARRFKVDSSDIKHVACSEIRAITNSGECFLWREIWRGHFQFPRGFQPCIRRRAREAIWTNEAIPIKDRRRAGEVVDEVFHSCFNDTRPFDTARLTFTPVDELTRAQVYPM